MASDPHPLSEAALEDVAYLSRSVNRVRLLEALTGGPHTRRELMAETGVSRTTLGRILNELTERGWVERDTDGRYAATATGTHVAAEFMELLVAMETVESLGEAVAWLPEEAHDVGLAAFRDATVHRPAANSPLEFAQILVERIADARWFCTLTYLAPPKHSVAEVLHERIRSGRLRTEFVLAGGLTETLVDDPDRRTWWHESVESGAVVYRYDGYIPCNLFVVDEAVLIVNTAPEDGPPGAFLESDDPRVLEWAADLVETHRTDAERLDAAAFT